MKKIFTLSVLSLFAMLIFSACTKNTYIDNNDSYWLSKERGQVVYSSADCGYYVVETNNGYAVVVSTDGYRPFEGSTVYGNFSNRGIRDLYNYTNGIVIRGDVREYWLPYAEAQNAIDYYCYY